MKKSALFLCLSIVSQVFVMAQGVKNLTLNSNININDGQAKEFKARDYLNLTPGFSADARIANAGTYNLYCDINIAAPAEYGTLSSTGTPSNQTPFSTANAVGTIAGSADVNATGAATYNIPLNIPHGTAGMQPKLSIGYNSQSGNALLGKGWDLCGLSAIGISSRNKAYDYNEAKLNSEGEGYSLDGQRLILISGVYGAPGSVYNYEMINFDRIEIPTDGLGFIVKTKEGKILEYGRTVDSRILGDVQNSSTYVWRLNKVKDANGNYIQYNYDQENGESWVKTILYTGNEKGALPYAQLQFVYDERKDINTSYHSRGKYVQKRILSSVLCSVQNILIKKYDFMYVYNVTMTQLSEIKETGKDGTFYNTTKIDWGLLSRNIEKSNINTTLIGGQENLIFNGDFDGNGINDCISISKLYNKTNRYNPRFPTERWGHPEGVDLCVFTENGVVRSLGSIPNVHWLVNIHPVDVDKDGKTELLFHYQDNANNSEEQVQQNNTKNNVWVQLMNLDLPSRTFILRNDAYGTKYNFYKSTPNTFYASPTNLVLGDFDGNGEVDYLIKRPGEDGTISALVNLRHTAENILDGSAYCAEILRFTNWSRCSSVIDYNGDGISELLTLNRNFSAYGAVAKYTPTGFVDVLDNIPESNGGGNDAGGYTNWRNHFGDYNGDGKTDLLTYKRTDYNGNGFWDLRISNGVNYNEVKRVTLPAMDNNFSNWVLITSDVNNDGKQDIILSNITNSVNLNVFVYLYDGKDFVLNSQGLVANIGGKTTSLAECLTLMDVPDNVTGKIDGKLDLIYDFCSLSNQGWSCDNGVFNFHKNETADLVDKITDGLKNETIFTYDNLNAPGIYTQNGPAITIANARYLPPSALYVVTKLQLSNKPFSSFNESTFKYTGLLFHYEGKGALGFAKIERTNVLENQKVDQLMCFDNFQPYTKISTTYTADGLVKTGTTTTSKTYSVAGKFIKVLEINTSKSLNLQNVRTETKEEYDLNGNPFRITSSTYDNVIGGNCDYTKIIENQFTASGSYMPNVISSCSNSNHYKIDEVAPSINITNYIYENATGNLALKTENYGLPNEISVVLSNRDIYGTARQFTTSALDVPTKIIKNELDPTGRFVTK